MSHPNKIDTQKLQNQAENNYALIGDLIRRFGTPNAQFPKDKDIEFGRLRELAGNIGGLSTILKNMKRENLVGYSDAFIKDNTVITLVEDYYQQLVPLGMTYEEIRQKINYEDTSHLKASSTMESDV